MEVVKNTHTISLCGQFCWIMMSLFVPSLQVQLDRMVQ